MVTTAVVNNRFENKNSFTFTIIWSIGLAIAVKRYQRYRFKVWGERFHNNNSCWLLAQILRKLTSSIARRVEMRVDRVQHQTNSHIYDAILFFISSVVKIHFPPSLLIAIISNNIQLKFIAKDVSIQNVPTIHNLFDLIILSRGWWRSKMLICFFTSPSCYYWEEKYLIKWITMDETCNTRKRREDEITICDANLLRRLTRERLGQGLNGFSRIFNF